MDAFLALVAALLFALGTVIQQREAMKVPDAEAHSAGLLLRLAKRPAWLAGMVADALGFIAQAAALGIGRVIVVQPLLATSVVWALPLGAKLSGQQVVRRDVVAALAVTAGLGAFLVISDPSGGRDDAPIAAWLVAGGAICAASAVLALAGMSGSPARKAAACGTAAGLLFGLSAVLTKAVVDSLDEGIVDLITDWHLYALVAIGFASMTLSQISLQAGDLAPAVATQMIFDPVASLILGLTLLQEQIHDDALGIAGSIAALLVTFAGMAVLATRDAGPPAPEQHEPSPARA
ncbi:MAG TPA: DMT family transporter [Solirubrobacterales bacterium]